MELHILRFHFFVRIWEVLRGRVQLYGSHGDTITGRVSTFFDIVRNSDTLQHNHKCKISIFIIKILVNVTFTRAETKRFLIWPKHVGYTQSDTQ
jgi:hypothetical protein